MNHIKTTLTLILLFTLLKTAQSQDLESKIEFEKKRIENFFLDNIPYKTTKDSTMIYAFAYKITVLKNANGVLEQTSLTASDTVAFRIYPGYEFLKTINYDLFMKDRKAGIFIFPVLIEVIGSQSENYKKDILSNYFVENVFRGNISKNVAAMFYYHPNENNKTESYTYFEPILMRLDKRKMY
ncbi:hypothetical protein [Daejeonella sp.]|uniref:hypothetical protein n=1 Tax=Daejeonella sp. TaxID=2805397 RepID=UPI0030C01E5F